MARRRAIGFYTRGHGHHAKRIPITVGRGRHRKIIYRTPHSLAIDRALKAKVTTDPEKYAKNPNRLDMPGVDLPAKGHKKR